MDPFALIGGATALAGLALAVAALLKGWQAWLDVQRVQLGAGAERRPSAEVRGLRERVRKLERIALGLD
ncbi:MAG TPA: hypothetical protein VF631_10215 [Allosphingosinicella sp.]|uniref:hypothetical protein n=1 Tax=Allosphingosinicella sp. TaxID=2823234 RepID=UPI002F298A3A